MRLNSSLSRENFKARTDKTSPMIDREMRYSGSERTASLDRSDGEKHGIPKLHSLQPIHIRVKSLFEGESIR